VVRLSIPVPFGCFEGGREVVEEEVVGGGHERTVALYEG